MKIVSWNCNGAFRNKIDSIESYQADLYIIQECENPALSTCNFKEWAGDSYIWQGKSKNKGIGIFPRNSLKIDYLEWSGDFKIDGLNSNSSSLSWSLSDLEQFIPFSINNQYTFVAVWTKRNKSEVFGYMGQFWKYLQIVKDKVSGEKVVICGDFNSNSTWDKEDRWWNHSDVVNELEQIGLKSLYHCQKNETQGQESEPTFYMHRNIEKPYHIDYCFVSSDLIKNTELEIGNKMFLSSSDHLPISFVVNNKVL